LISYW